MNLDSLMTQPTLTLDHDPATDLFRIHGATQAHQMGLLAIPGCRYATKGRDYWTIPARYAQIAALGATYKVDWTQRAVDRFLPIHAQVEACRRLRTEGLTEEEDAHMRALLSKHGVVPKPGQATAMVQLATAEGAALFSETGAGKSLVVSGASKLYDISPILIVCPPSVLYNWSRELNRFGMKSTVLDGTPAQKRKIMENLDLTETPVLICSYGVAKKLTRLAPYGSTALKRCDACGGAQEFPEEKCETHERFLNTIAWEAVIFDEGHRLRDPHTVVTRAAWYLASSVRYRWVLTGTPIESNAAEFWSILHLLDPLEHPSSVKHRDRYLLQNLTFWGELEIVGINPVRKAEYDDITQWRWRRDVKVGLPETRYEVRTTTLSPKAAKAYKQMEKQLMAEVGMPDSTDTTVLLAANHMVKHGRLLQFANATCEMDDNGEVTMVDPSDKADLFMDTLEDFNEPVIAWSSSLKFLKLLSARLDAKGIKHTVIHGETSAKKRQEAVDAFQKGDVDLILLNPAAGGEGITLTRARVSIRIMRPASSIQDTQLKGRNNRYGVTHDELLIVDLITLGTVEEFDLERLDEKNAALREIIG